MREELGQSFALLPRRSDPWIRISEPSQRRVEKFISGRSASAGPLSVERPPKNQLCRTVMTGGHSSEPMVNQRRLTDTTPGNDCNDVDILVCPSTIEKGDILLSTK